MKAMKIPSIATTSLRPKSSSIVVISLMATLCCFLRDGTASATPTKNFSVPAVIAFGDSIVDPGNNNDLATIAKCNFPPYGRDFAGAESTGRFSNGRIPSDMLAEAFGVKHYLPPYLDPDLQIQDLLTGVSFGSGAGGYDPLTAEIALVLSLSDQLDLFKEYVERITAEVGEERAAAIVSESVYIVCTGSDDITNTYYETPARSLQYDISSYTDLMVDWASDFIQELYGLGARRIGVMGIPPIGCVPSQRTLRGGTERQCFDSANEAAILFNSKLCSRIESLDGQLPGSRIVYLDIFYPSLSIIQNPAQYGFEVTTRGCCGTGNIEVSYLCNSLDGFGSCIDDQKYVFWDSFHPTEKAYRIVTMQIFRVCVNKFF